MPDEMFLSAVRSSGDLSGCFEHDGETAFFYLADRSRPGGQQVVDAIHVLTGRPDFSEQDLEVRWSADGEVVGCFVRGRLWAAFGRGKKYGGDYRADGRADIPESVAAALGPRGGA